MRISPVNSNPGHRGTCNGLPGRNRLEGRRATGALDSAIGASVERKILWLAGNAAVVIHRRLVGMPDELAGLCKLRVGDWRILYWIYPSQTLIRIYRIQHRSEVYRDF